MGTGTEEKIGILTLGTTSDRSTSLIEYPITHCNNHRVAFETGENSAKRQESQWKTQVVVDWEDGRKARKI